MFTMLEQALNLDGAGKHLFPVCTLLRVVFPLVDLTVLAATVDRTGLVRGGTRAALRDGRATVLDWADFGSAALQIRISSSGR